MDKLDKDSNLEEFKTEYESHRSMFNGVIQGLCVGVVVLFVFMSFAIATGFDLTRVEYPNGDIVEVQPVDVEEELEIEEVEIIDGAVDVKVDVKEEVKESIREDKVALEISKPIEKDKEVVVEKITPKPMAPAPKPEPEPEPAPKPEPKPEVASKPQPKPEVRKNKMCIGSQCGDTINYGGSDASQYQTVIDTNKIVSYSAFNSNDGKSTYFAGHQSTAFGWIRNIVKMDSVIDMYDANGEKSSYKVVMKTNTNREGQWEGSPVTVYGGIGPIQALYEGASEEVIYIQYCWDGYPDGSKMYVWSAVKI